MLEGVDLQTLLPEYRQHAYHIFGLALLQDGAHERAINVIEEGRRTTKGYCRLDDLLAVIKPLRDEKDPCSPLGSSVPPSARPTPVCSATTCRARARRSTGGSCGRAERSSRSRASPRWSYRRSPDRAIGRFRKALALVRFLDAHRMFAALRKELPLQGTSWPAPRIADLERAHRRGSIGSVARSAVRGEQPAHH
jgi:hypothetical protein